jgi:toxin-antitoxin system PIN domain toxin
MKRCLADVNLLLPLLVRHHEQHDAALRWFDGLAAGEALLCRFVQLALIRLLGNRSIMGDYALPASSAWELLGKLMEDERVEFVAEPARLDVEFAQLLGYSMPTGKLVGDAYLAAFALAGQFRFATFDAGFREFRELELQLITAPLL